MIYAQILDCLYEQFYRIIKPKHKYTKRDVSEANWYAAAWEFSVQICLSNTGCHKHRGSLYI